MLKNVEVTATTKDKGALDPDISERARPFVREGEGSTFELFYKSEFLSVLNAVRAFSGDTDLALDATQEAFSRAFARWRRLQERPWARGWVITTAMNVCRRSGRLGQRRGKHGRANNPATQEPGVERLDLLAALRTLPPRQKQATVLFYVADLPLEGVADLMGLSEGAVKAHLSKARQALRLRLEEQ